LTFFEPGKGQLFWLWLKKGLKKSSKKLKTGKKNFELLLASLSLKKGFLSFIEPEKGLFELL
jgi:hypothetical protein